MSEVHTAHCAKRMAWGDGECECGANRIYWLIERGSPAEWWVCGSAQTDRGPVLHEEWTRDASKAMRLNEWGAKQEMSRLEQWGVQGPLRVTEHMDCPGEPHE